MDATQFQAAVLAWGSAATVTIGVLVALAIALIKGVNSIRDATVANATAVEAVKVKTEVHDRQLNGDLVPRVAAIADQRIAAHRRPGDVAPAVSPTAAPNA